MLEYIDIRYNSSAEGIDHMQFMPREPVMIRAMVKGRICVTRQHPPEGMMLPSQTNPLSRSMSSNVHSIDQRVLNYILYSTGVLLTLSDKKSAIPAIVVKTLRTRCNHFLCCAQYHLHCLMFLKRERCVTIISQTHDVPLLHAPSIPVGRVPPRSFVGFWYEAL